MGRNKWFNLLWLLPIGWAVLLIAATAAQGLRNMPVVQRFMARYLYWTRHTSGQDQEERS